MDEEGLKLYHQQNISETTFCQVFEQKHFCNPHHRVYSNWHTALKEDDGKADDVVKQLRRKKGDCLITDFKKVVVNDDPILKLVGVTWTANRTKFGELRQYSCIMNHERSKVIV